MEARKESFMKNKLQFLEDKGGVFFFYHTVFDQFRRSELRGREGWKIEVDDKIFRVFRNFERTSCRKTTSVTRFRATR